MRITDQLLDQAFSDLRKTCGGRREDYFGLLYLEQEHQVPREQAVNQVAFLGRDYGVDGFHFDQERRNFYLFQFKYSEDYAQFKPTFQRLLDAGMQRLFGAEDQDTKQNQLVQQIKSSLLENSAIIERFYFHFVFLGDVDAAEQSRVLADQKEALENKKYLIDNLLGRSDDPQRQVSLVVEFKSARSRRVGGTTKVQRTRVFPLRLKESISRSGPGPETMHVAFVPLIDLHAIYADLKWRFFERNIRAALSEDEAVNVALRAAFKRIVVEGRDSPEAFAFNHNGVTLAAETLRSDGAGAWKVTSPRLLNGAQTVATFAKFLEDNKGNRRLADPTSGLDRIYVLCRIITEASDEFITTVTVNNNRQNPVDPWNLRANDRIQLELFDKFHDEVRLYYERHERAFQGLSDEDIQDLEVEGGKALELYRMAQTFAVADGEIDKLRKMRDVFEDDRLYAQLFGPHRLKADSRKVVLCYKAGLYAGRLAREIEDSGRNKYEFVWKGRNLLWALTCQGMLNDVDVGDHAEAWGSTLVMDMDFRSWLLGIAKTKCRFILADLIQDRAYREKVAAGTFDFLKTAEAFKRSMEIAHRRFRWTRRDLS